MPFTLLYNSLLQKVSYKTSYKGLSFDSIEDARKAQELERIYSELVATAIHTVKPENIATFLGHKLDPRYQGEIGNNYDVRIP